MALTPPRTPPTSLPSSPDPNRPSSPTPSNTPLSTPGPDSPPVRPGLNGKDKDGRKGSFRNRMSSILRRNSSVVSAVNAFQNGIKDKDKNGDRGSKSSKPNSGRATPARRSSESALRESFSVPATPAALDVGSPPPVLTSRPASISEAPTETQTPAITTEDSDPPPSLLPSPDITPSKPRLDRTRLSVLGRGDYMMPSPVAESPMREEAATSPLHFGSRLSQVLDAPGLEDSEEVKLDGHGLGATMSEEPGPMEEKETTEVEIPPPAMPEPEHVHEAGQTPAMPVPEPVANGDTDGLESSRTSEEYVRVPPLRDVDAEEAAARRIQLAWRRSRSSETVVPAISTPMVVPEIVEPDSDDAARTIQRAWRRRRSTQSAKMPMPMPEPVVMSLPPMKDLMVAPSISTVETNGYAASERTPLLGHKTTPAPGHAVDLLGGALASASTSRAVAVTPKALGWTEYHLPDLSAPYFHHVRMGVTTNIDLHAPGKAEQMQSWMEGTRVEEDAEGRTMEVWVREAGPKKVFERWWVDHERRDVLRDEQTKRVPNEDIDAAFRYWSYVDAHPAHVKIAPTVLKEAVDTLAWARSECVLPSSSSSGANQAVAAFTREECDELQNLLASSSGLMQTRVVARIMLRSLEWRQRTQRPHKPLPHDVPSASELSRPQTKRVHFGRAVFDIFVGITCLGIPALFLNRNRPQHGYGHLGYDYESGYAMSGPGPTLMVCACSCLTAAIVLSASVTFISLPNLDELARLAALLAILASTASMASTVLALFRYKLDIERTTLLPHPFYTASEGLIGFTRRSVLMSMPLVFLAWAVIAFAAGIGAYAFSVGAAPGSGSMRKIGHAIVQWTVLCAFGGVLGVVLTGAVFVR